MSKIYKFYLKLAETQKVWMPKDSVILDVQLQHEHIVFWAIVPSDIHDTHRYFRIIGTGDTFDKTNLVYLKSVQQGWTVWHVFEDKSPKFNTELHAEILKEGTFKRITTEDFLTKHHPTFYPQ